MTIFRHARREDAAALGRVFADWIYVMPWIPRIHTRDADRGFVAMPLHTSEATVPADDPAAGLLAREGDEVPAFCLTARACGPGLGARLLAAARAQSPRLLLWAFHACRGTLRPFRRAGFVEVYRAGGQNAGGLPDIRLRWEAP